MKFLFYTFFISLTLVLPATAQKTVFEKSDGLQTATYQEIIQWYKDLDNSSTQLLIKEMGPTDAGYPLHLVLISGDGNFEPAVWQKKDKIILFINNGIHPGEPDGIDASMMLARDLVTGKKPLPVNVIVALIPVYNIGGCLNRNQFTRVNQNGPESYGFRGNSQNLDLNRDFTKCDSREARSFAGIFHYLRPHLFVDTHVSDGADFQHTMTLISTQYNKLGESIGAWMRDSLETALYQKMGQKGWEMIPYVEFETSDPGKGFTMFYDPPRYSSGYAALFQCFSFITETHMLKPFPQRVKSTYDFLVSMIAVATEKRKDILQKRKETLQLLASQQHFPLQWIPSGEKDKPGSLLFKGYEKDTTTSEATGLPKMFFNHNKPFTKQVVYHHSYKPIKLVTKPLAYVIPRGWHSVIELLKINRVKVDSLQNDSTIKVTISRIDSFKSYSRPYEKHHKNYQVHITTVKEDMQFLKGDYIIYCNQEVNRYIIEMLEPTGDDSFFAWNFFDAILQQKEGYSDYRWDELAAEWLKKDIKLQMQLAEKKAKNPGFEANSAQILEFIYKNSPYYEKSHMRYPVYRIE